MLGVARPGSAPRAAGGQAPRPSRGRRYADPAIATMSEILPYGAWRSPITSDLIVGETLGLGGILIDGRDIYWVEGRPRESGRSVLVRRVPPNSTNPGIPGILEDIT